VGTISRICAAVAPALAAVARAPVGGWRRSAGDSGVCPSVFSSFFSLSKSIPSSCKNLRQVNKF
jgi:hypothetical protein